jgi:hypothetical protein
MGNNYPTGFQNHKKHNQGFGNVGGDKNHISGSKSMLDDSDSIDLFGGSDIEIPEWVQRMAGQRSAGK